MTRGIADHTGAARPVLRPLADVLAARTGAGGDAAHPGPADAAAPAPAHRTDTPVPVTADRVMRAAVEILCGRRAAEQLRAVMRPDQLDYLVGLRTATGRLRPQLQSVHTQQPAPGVVEATAVIVLRTGVRALSARFETHVGAGGARWQCTALHLPLTRGDVTAARRLR